MTPLPADDLAKIARTLEVLSHYPNAHRINSYEIKCLQQAAAFIRAQAPRAKPLEHTWPWPYVTRGLLKDTTPHGPVMTPTDRAANA